MEDIGLGKLIEHERLRDAVHIAVIPCTAGEHLEPGTHVKLDAERFARKSIFGPRRWKRDGVGIVDPFLTEPVTPGEKFWLFLYPGSIQGLRHDWTHKEFPTAVLSDAKSRSMDWLVKYAQETGIPYDMLLACHSGNNESFQPSDEFWTHWSVLTGKDPEDEGRYFSCAC